MHTNMTLREMLNEASLSSDPLTRRLAAIMEPVAFYQPQILNAGDLEEAFEEYETEIRGIEYLKADHDDEVIRLENEIRSLKITINSLRYELDSDQQVHEIDLLRNNVMELADKNIEIIKEKNRINTLYLELLSVYEDLESKYKTWEAISKSY